MNETIFGRHASALGLSERDLSPTQIVARAEWRRANRTGGAIGGAGSAAYFAKRAAALGRQVAVAVICFKCAETNR